MFEFHFCHRRLARFLAILALSLFIIQSPAADVSPAMNDVYQPTNGEFDAVARAVTQLLRSKNAAAFATNLSVSVSDWHDIITTNLPSDVREKLEGYAATSDYGFHRVEAQARALVARAAKMHLNFQPRSLPFHINAPSRVNKFYFGDLKSGGVGLPYLNQLEIILHPPAYAADEKFGEFKLVINGLQKFPGGWRIVQGLQWASFPTNLLSVNDRHVMAFLDKAEAGKSLTAKDDPALKKFGRSLADFIRSGDTNLFVNQVMMNSDLLWAQFQKTGRMDFTHERLNASVSHDVRKETAAAVAMLKQLTDLGVNLKNATIHVKQVELSHAQPEGVPGSLDGLLGSGFKLTLAVKNAGRAGSGVSASGDYTLAVASVMRFGNDWRIMSGLRWMNFPPGVMDAKAEDKLKFDNYVATHGTLPVGTTAPDVEFTTLANGKEMKLSDLRGKVVVLDFWATWCVPCQQPMADLQKIRETHADWGDKVVIMPLSIDNTIGIVRKHIARRSWTNTFNVWAGDGGWSSAPARAFHLSAVPTTYIIDADGKIAKVGQPSVMPIGKIVDNLLKP